MAENLNQEMWRQRRQRLEALIRADPNQRRHDPAEPDNIVDPRLYLAAKKGDIDEFIRALEDHCARERVSLPIVLGLRSPSKNTLLHAAAESDDNVRAVIDFVPKHLISCKNSRGETPLHIAARAGKTIAVELLLPQGNPRCTDRSGNSALHEAVRNRHYEVIRQLVSEDPNPLYYQNKESKSPWCVAVKTEDLEVLRVLLGAPNDGEDQRRLDIERVFGMSPVHVAIMYQNMDMLNATWKRKPWLFQLRDVGNGTPLHLAAYSNYHDGVRFLMEKCPTSALEQDSTDGYLPIHVACMMNHIGIVKELLWRWSDPAEFLTRLGQNILYVSARYGCNPTVKEIMKNPNFSQLINARDFDGNTPLHLAALHYQPSIMFLARDRRVDLKLVNKNKMTALDMADQDIKAIGAPLRKRLIWIILVSAGTPRSRELDICKPTGRSPWKRKELQEPDRSKDKANTRMVVAVLMATVTFTSNFSVPEGYNGSDPDAGIPILLHKAMYNVFVISNSVAMYSSIMTIVILLWTHINDPYVMGVTLFLSTFPLLVALAAMPLAFMAGIYVTVTKLAWLSIFVLVFGSFALYIILSFFILLYFFPLGCRNPLIHGFTDRLILVVLAIARREAAGRETAARAATAIRGTCDDNQPPPLE
ncbi:protein ACCELERATED CELL DEATH 6-like [Syzygium oleosum]|uniref:protein ACCELERATED CELL DEATH 6-like n=1 Tax=Syzygium oleosum TaxID=219896 RepID=UPI0024BBC4DC|nr:protein ACCELERATED CELL DEATH 6-like [Syzygium oleosum]